MGFHAVELCVGIEVGLYGCIFQANFMFTVAYHIYLSLLESSFYASMPTSSIHPVWCIYMRVIIFINYFRRAIYHLFL